MKVSLLAAAAAGASAQANLANRDAKVTSDPCTTTTTLPTLTATFIGDGYEHCYTVIYDEWCTDGIRPHTYTLTETCNDPAGCHGQAGPTGTANPPPGFTCGVVACPSCPGGKEVGGTTLTYPTESVSQFSSIGCTIETIPVETAHLTHNGGGSGGDSGQPPVTGQQPTDKVGPTQTGAAGGSGGESGDNGSDEGVTPITAGASSVGVSVGFVAVAMALVMAA